MTKGKRIKKFVISIVITVVIGLIMDYLWPTPWNLHSMSTWFKTIILLFLFSGINALNFTVGMTKYDMKYVEKEVSFPFFIPIALGIIMVNGTAYFFQQKTKSSSLFQKDLHMDF